MTPGRDVTKLLYIQYCIQVPYRDIQCPNNARSNKAYSIYTTSKGSAEFELIIVRSYGNSLFRRIQGVSAKIC